MALPEFIIDQLRRPRGPLAPLMGALLNGINFGTIRAGVRALDLRPRQRVLEIGFGGGLSLPLLLLRVGSQGQVFALETSQELLDRAKRRFILARLQGRLRLEWATIEAMPVGDGAFDAALSLNTIAFWTDLDQAMRELARVLAPGGRLVLGVPDPDELLEAGFAARGCRVVEPDKLAAKLPDYGFEVLELETVDDGTCLVIARRVDEGWGDEL